MAGTYNTSFKKPDFFVQKKQHTLVNDAQPLWQEWKWYLWTN